MRKRLSHQAFSEGTGIFFSQIRLSVCLTVGLATMAAAAVVAASSPNTNQVAVRPVLQVINGSRQPIDIWWLRTAEDRVHNGQLQPGSQISINTTIGHRFLLVGQHDGFEQPVSSLVPIQSVRFDSPDPDGVPPCYTQREYVTDFPIVATAAVNPYALKEAAFLVGQMLKQRPDILQAMVASGSRLCILGCDEYTTDQPELSHLAASPVAGMPHIPPADYWDARARGMGGSQTDPFCSCGEENLLGYPGDPYATECILIHELAHNIHLRGMQNLDPTFDMRLREAYDQAIATGLWKGVYASVNHHEYFAEGVQSWFDNNRSNDAEHNDVDTREELIAYDPLLAGLCREVFGDTELRYTKPSTRLHGHLAGYDPTRAPSFKWPPRLQAAQQAIREQVRTRRQEALEPPSKKPPGLSQPSFE